MVEKKLKDLDASGENDSEESVVEEVETSLTLRVLRRVYATISYVAGIFNNRFGRLLLCSFILFVCGIVFWTFKMEIKNKANLTREFDLKYLFFFLSASLLVFMGLSLVLYHSSYFALKHTYAFNSIFYYVNELSEHLSLGMIIVTAIIIQFVYQQNYCFSNMHGYDIYIGDVLNISLIVVFMFGALKVWTKTISMNFNYQIYIERILRVLVEAIFISTLKIVSKPRADGRSIPSGTLSDPNTHSDFFDSSSSPLRLDRSILNKECGFSGNEILKICFSNLKSKMSTRRILLKEFQKFCRNKKVTYELPVDQTKIERRAMAQAEALGERGLRDISSLSPYISDITKFSEVLKVPLDYRLTKKNLFMPINRIYREKYYLLRNLEQMNGAIDRVAFVFKMVILILGGIMLYIKVSKEFAATATIISAIFGTQFISHSFSSNAINSMIFLFFIHPYDIGDRVFIKIDDKVENLVVSELNVFSTVFFRWDGTCVYVPNAVLSGKLICNIRRSGVMGESHKIQINARTNQHKLNKLKCCIEDFVKSKGDVYTEYTMMNYEFIENSNKLHMKIYMQYKDNWQDYGAYLTHKTTFLSFLNRTLHALEIDYTLPPQRVMLKNCE